MPCLYVFGFIINLKNIFLWQSYTVSRRICTITTPRPSPPHKGGSGWRTKKLRAEIPNIEVEILGVADASASILQVTDVKSGSVNDLLTPGRNLRIVGSKLKLAGDNPANGVFFVDTATQARTAVDPSDIVTNNPSELLVVIPPLAAGKYTVEVVTQYAGGKILLKEPRTAGFDKPLTVG